MSDANANANRDAIAAKIRALLAKTTENGCTEAEALAAAAVARRLMDQHRLSQSDVEIEAEPIDTALVDRPTAQKLSPVDYTLHGIDAYCGVKTWFSTRIDTTSGQVRMCVKILGLKADVEMARYLYGMLADAIRIEGEHYVVQFKADRWGASSAETKRVKQTFQVAMASRINSRLKEMAETANEVAKTSNGTALVVVKEAAVDAAFAALNLRFGRSSRGLSMSGGHSAANAGRAAGDRVNLSRPVGGGHQGRLS
jgi:hypothetical protein